MGTFPHISDAETEIMKLIWAGGEDVTCQMLQKKLPAEKGWKTTTVLTFLSRLCEKGLLRVRKEGKTNVYTPCLTQQEFRSAETAQFLQTMHGGSVRSLLASLADARGLSSQDIEELKRWFDAQ